MALLARRPRLRQRMSRPTRPALRGSAWTSWCTPASATSSGFASRSSQSISRCSAVFSPRSDRARSSSPERCAPARGLSEHVRRSLAHFVTVWSLETRALSSDLVIDTIERAAQNLQSIISHICHRHARAGGGGRCDTQRPTRRFPGRRCQRPPPIPPTHTRA